MAEETQVERAKFELGPPKAAPAELDTGDLPWGYGEDRITAMVRDPDSAYLYWEISDEGIAAAGARLGPAGSQGWINLRIYDTSGRAFDGTNANDYFDIRVERTDREHYVMVRRPGSSMHAEVGVKTHEGFFQPIARSGRADFPRSHPSPNTTLDWMTVTSTGTPPCAAPYVSRCAGGEPPLPGREGAGYFDVWHAPAAPPMPEPSPGPLRFAQWISALEDAGVAWREGPFPLMLHDPERVAIELLGEAPAHFRADQAGFTAYGPWRIVVHSFGPEADRRVLASWSMRWVQASTPMIERYARVIERRVESAYERTLAFEGASEALVQGGASERWRIGGSERMWMGASEWLLGGASETAWLGASRLALAGASAELVLGASERLGGSERAAASESVPRYPHPGERWGGRLDGKGGR